MVILCVQQEVGAHDGHTHRHYDQDEEDKQHEAIHVVHLHVQRKSSGILCYTSVPRYNQLLMADFL